MKTTLKRIKTNPRLIKDLLTKYPDTFKALKELVNNSIHAEAKNININIEYVDTIEYPSGIQSISVRDDGYGVSYSDFDNKILEIGTTVKSKGHGIGRFSAFQIGQLMHIETVAFDEKENKYSKTVFSLNTLDLTETQLENIHWKVEYTFLKEKNTNTYYKVSINELHHNKQDKCPKRNLLTTDFMKENLAQALFENYPYEVFNSKVVFSVNGEKLLRDQFVKNEPSLKKVIYKTINGKEETLTFLFFNIRSTLNKVKVFFNIDNAGIKSVAHEFTYSSDWYTPDLGTWFIYVESNLFDSDLFRNFDIESLGPRELSNLKQFVKDTINDFFKAKNKRYEKFLSKLENDKFYPYKNNSPYSDTQEVIFKKVAYILEDEHKLIQNQDKIRDFVYTLVDKSISNGDIEDIFKKILNLSDENLEKFRSLLDRTDIEDIVQFTTLVSSKLEFLDFLQELIYGEISSHIKERSQLHKIIEKQLWLFGESYNGTPTLWSDKKIGNILKDLREKLFVYEPTEKDGNLIDVEGVNDITDLFFFNERIIGNNEREIMVVELKAPRVAISDTELRQIDRYAFTIEENSSFPSSKVKYKLVLISSRLTKYARSKLKSSQDKYKDIPFLYEKKTEKNIEIYVMEWSDLIELNKRKLGYLSSQLNIKEKTLKEKFESEYPELVDEKISSQLRLIK